MKKKIKECSRQELINYFSQNLTMTMADVEKFVDSLCFLRESVFMGERVINIDFLNEEVEIPQAHILDKKEHNYLRAVCKPFFGKIKYICKTIDMREDYVKREKIIIQLKGEDGILSFPLFDSNSMYKGMELNKYYTIEYLELGKDW